MAPRTPRPTSLLRQSADSVDAPYTLLPHFDALFAGLGSLGSAPRKTLAMLREAGLRRGASVIDLGCGKGAVSVELARRLGARVDGYEVNPSFAQSARRLAKRHGLGARCVFFTLDMRAAARATRGEYDCALALGVMPTPEAVALARRCVRPGGLYAIDDAFFDPRFPASALPAACPTREECLAVFKARGDRLLAEWVPTPSLVRRQNDSILRRLRGAARALARAHPELAPDLREFIARQTHASRLLGGPLRPALWVVRRVD